MKREGKSRSEQSREGKRVGKSREPGSEVDFQAGQWVDGLGCANVFGDQGLQFALALLLAC